MKKKIKEWLLCFLLAVIVVAVLVGMGCIIMACPKLNQLMCNALGADPMPWNEAKKLILRRLPVLTPYVFILTAVLYSSGEEEEDNDDEKKN